MGKGLHPGEAMIVEVILSTLSSNGEPNFAPMGVVWGEEEITVRPFRNTQTFRNLVATKCGVASVTDDVLAFARSALEDACLPHFPARSIPGIVFQGCCYWRELEVMAIEEGEERAEVHCRVVEKGWQRDFLGFNRARNAVIEAAILATRMNLIPREEALTLLERYAEIVQKTGDEPEGVAFELVRQYIIKGGKT